MSAEPSVVPAGPLAGWQQHEFAYDNVSRMVFRRGSGPGVIVIHEIPGITPKVAAFGQRLVDDGFTVLMPSLFGTPSKEPSMPYGMGEMVKGCVSREFTTWALHKTSPITRWLRALARDLHEELGGPGVGALGMCFTGGFALAMMVDDHTVAPVLSQPSLPFALTSSRKADVGLSPDDLQRVRERDCDVLGLRFMGDSFVPKERFDTLRRELGDRFLAVEIDSSPGNAFGIPKNAHSVLTEHFVDEPDHPTRHALDQVLQFFHDRLEP